MEVVGSISRSFFKEWVISFFLLSIPAILQTVLMPTDILNLTVSLGWRLCIAEQHDRVDPGSSHCRAYTSTESLTSRFINWREKHSELAIATILGIFLSLTLNRSLTNRDSTF